MQNNRHKFGPGTTCWLEREEIINSRTTGTEHDGHTGTATAAHALRFMTQTTLMCVCLSSCTNHDEWMAAALVSTRWKRRLYRRVPLPSRTDISVPPNEIYATYHGTDSARPAARLSPLPLRPSAPGTASRILLGYPLHTALWIGDLCNEIKRLI